MQAADYKLILTQAPEVCSIGMAPTTSTTLTLALGYALAFVVMYELRPSFSQYILYVARRQHGFWRVTHFLGMDYQKYLRR